MRTRHGSTSKLALLLLFGVIFAMQASSGFAQQAATDTALQEQLLANEKELWRAILARDVNSIKATFAGPDAIWNTPGPGGVHEDPGAWFAKIISHVTVSKAEIGRRPDGSELVWVRKIGNDGAVLAYELKVTVSTGSWTWPMLTTYVRRAEKWRILAIAEVQEQTHLPVPPRSR